MMVDSCDAPQHIPHKIVSADDRVFASPFGPAAYTCSGSCFKPQTSSKDSLHILRWRTKLCMLIQLVRFRVHHTMPIMQADSSDALQRIPQRSAFTDVAIFACPLDQPPIFALNSDSMKMLEKGTQVTRLVVAISKRYNDLGGAVEGVTHHSSHARRF
jgi:hypothetical protein